MIKRFLWFAGVISAAFFAACASSPGSSHPTAMPSESHKLEFPEERVQQMPLRFLVMGDTQNPKKGKPQNDAERRAIYARFTEVLDDSMMVVHLGDLVKTGAALWEWRKFFDGIFWDKLTDGQRRRFFPIPGNHEYKTHFFDYGGGDLSLYFERFPHIRNQRYYFFTHGNAGFVFMDAGRNGVAKLLGGEGWQNGVEEQIEWLRKVVFPHLRRKAEETGLERIFLFYHKPGYATPVYVKNGESVRMLRRFDRFNRENGNRFEIFAFAGHVHTFAHIAKNYGDDGGGEIDQFTVGTGGGTQRGRTYFRKVERVEDLDRYRLAKYREETREGEFDQEVFDRVRFDKKHFGYLEVIADEKVEFLYHRYDKASGDFYVDYEFAR